jgi:hypothetical protein
MLASDLRNIMEKFTPITLAEMDEVKLMNRVDTKFAFPISVLKSLLEQLNPDYRILAIQDTRMPFYESLYFDESDFKFFKDHHNGRTNRFKVRFRQYTESNLFFLEVKHKIKGRTKKSRILVDNIPDVLEESHLSFLKKFLPKETPLEPKIWNSFHRITLVNNERIERLTLDFQLTFRWGTKKIEFNNLVIAELKQEKLNIHSPFYKLMKSNTIRPYRLSKYCLGTIELYQGSTVKYNRFKEKILKLKSINK